MSRKGYFYILAGKKYGTLYCGVTNDIGRRIWEHKNGVASQFTKKYGVTKLVYVEEYDLVADAIQRETSVKKWKRDWKITMIESRNPEWRDLFEGMGP